MFVLSCSARPVILILPRAVSSDGNQATRLTHSDGVGEIKLYPKGRLSDLGTHLFGVEAAFEPVAEADSFNPALLRRRIHGPEPDSGTRGDRRQPAVSAARRAAGPAAPARAGKITSRKSVSEPPPSSGSSSGMGLAQLRQRADQLDRAAGFSADHVCFCTQRRLAVEGGSGLRDPIRTRQSGKFPGARWVPAG